MNDKMPESRLYQLMRTPFLAAGWHMYRIETGSTMAGFPDVIMTHRGRVVFCELKTTGTTKKGIVRPVYQPGQLSTLRKLARDQLDVCVCVAVGDVWYFSDPFEAREISELKAAHGKTVDALMLPL